MATHDVYSRAAQNLEDIIPVDAAKIAFSADGGFTFGVGMLAQSLQINYQQQINRLYEIGTNATYFVGGRTQGQMSMARVIGPRNVQVAFYTKYGNMCNAKTNNINLYTSGSCDAQGNNAGSKFTIMFSVITNIGITIGAQDMILNEQLQLMFVSLEVDTSAIAGVLGALAAGPPAP